MGPMAGITPSSQQQGCTPKHTAHCTGGVNALKLLEGLLPAAPLDCPEVRRERRGSQLGSRHCGAWAGGLLGEALVKGAGLQWEGGFLMHRYNLTTTGPKGEVDTSPRRPLADRTIHTDRAGTSLAVWWAT